MDNLTAMTKEIKDTIKEQQWFEVIIDHETEMIGGIKVDGVFDADELRALADIIDKYQGDFPYASA